LDKDLFSPPAFDRSVPGNPIFAATYIKIASAKFGGSESVVS
jgi:hypothetical protein